MISGGGCEIKAKRVMCIGSRSDNKRVRAQGFFVCVLSSISADVEDDRVLVYFSFFFSV